MARAGEILVATLELLESKIRPGASTAELDEIAERYIRSRGGTPTFKGYRGFPGSICASPNAMVVHGIPGPYRLNGGDIISIDVGVTLDGWVADAARTFPVGEGGKQQQTLLAATQESLHAGGAESGGGHRIWGVSSAIQQAAERAGRAPPCAGPTRARRRGPPEQPELASMGSPALGRGSLRARKQVRDPVAAAATAARAGAPESSRRKGS